MGLQTSIDFYFKSLSFKKIITKLSENWTFDHYGVITYMDNDDFEWKEDFLDNKEAIIQILEKRFKNKIVGITLVTRDKTGGMFLFYPNENVFSFIININRKKTKSTIFTDFSYYIENLNSILNDDIVFKIECNDIF